MLGLNGVVRFETVRYPVVAKVVVPRQVLQERVAQQRHQRTAASLLAEALQNQEGIV